VTVVNRQNVAVFRQPRRIYFGNTWRTLAALSAIGGIYVGTTYLEPEGYVVMARPTCRGITAEGCSLRWQNVPTDDGDTVAQCVQFCPRQTVGRTVPLVAPPVESPDVTGTPAPAPALAQNCELTIHSEPAFQGLSSPVVEDEPDLSEHGWDRSISSMEIKTGTWDFYADGNYGGQMIRLGPGSYPTLAEGWDKAINSMMCAQPPEP